MKQKLDFKKLLKENPFVLAPMDDVTDITFKELCEKNGASFCISELTSIDALIRDKIFPQRFKKGKLKLNIVQLFGKDPDTFVKAAKKLEKIADIIDINFGCPSPNVTKQKSGSFLLEDPNKVYEIISKLVKNTNFQITAKIRLGYKNTNHIKIAKEIQRAGASLITVHGRTAKQKYSGNANWNAIKEIYNNVDIPVIGNGDIKSQEDIDKYLNSHCDGLMIGRAAIGNPLIFKKMLHYYKTKNNLQITNKKETQKKLFLEYLKNAKKEQYYNFEIKIQRQAMWFFKGIQGVKHLREKLCKTKKINEIIDIIEKF